jgi:hypothetical protein
MKVDETQVNMFDMIDDVRVEAEDRETNIEAGHLCTVMNKLITKKPEDYDINYEYYLNECNKIIDKCEVKN